MSTDLLQDWHLDEGRTLIDDLLAEQQLPVARFSRKHERHTLPAQAKYYRDLIPLSSPAAGEQYAFAVDLDACTGTDAEKLAIGPNEKVRVASRRGQVSATAFITNTVQVGHLFIPMHYAAANELTFPAFDPYSRQPSYKACAVSVGRVASG